jgi:hypothetical protein
MTDKQWVCLYQTPITDEQRAEGADGWIVAGPFASHQEADTHGANHAYASWTVTTISDPVMFTKPSGHQHQDNQEDGA